MFAEELAGNATRKRQEEARARRRQLKQQQEKKISATEHAPVSSAARIAPSLTSSSSIPNTTAVTAATPISASSVSATSAATSTATVAPKPSAVANALQQRQLRQEQQLREKSALRIQSFYRAHCSNVCLRNAQASLLTQRLADLTKLRALIRQKTSSEYVPPPANVTALVRQLLFLCKSLPYHKTKLAGRTRKVEMVARSDENAIRLQQVLQYAVLPGMIGADDSLDPCLTWLSSGDGRLVELVRLCLVVATRSRTPESILATIDLFLRSGLGLSSETPASGLIVEEIRQILPTAAAWKDPIDNALAEKNTCLQPFAVLKSPLDLVAILRHQLLFSGGAPIPADASRRREKCISALDRMRNDVLFQLTLDASQTAQAGSERRRLQTRFVAEILTTPLLTWRLSSKSITKLLEVDPGRKMPILLIMVTSFVELHAATLSAGKVASLLPTMDVPLTKCPAVPTQCLLANLIQVGRICPGINGSDVRKLNFQCATLFFNFLATLIDVVPLGAFSSRDSSVEWIHSGSHHTPIVLSPIIIEQCKLLLVDSYVRNLFACAINNDILDTERVLRTKNDKDLKHEKDLADAGSSSAATLAAKEARVDRNKGFWQSTSKWARKLSGGVSKSLSSPDKKGPGTPSPGKKKGPGMLMDTSSVSRRLAHGKSPRGGSVTNAILASHEAAEGVAEPEEGTEYDRCFFIALCRAYGCILARWGGGGRDDIVKRKLQVEPTRSAGPKEEKSDATSVADPITRSLLNVICFSTTIVQTTWAMIQSDARIVSDVYSVIDSTKGSTPIRSLKIRPMHGDSLGKSRDDGSDGAVLLYLFVCCLVHTLIITDDSEIHDMAKPILIHQVRRCIQVLKKLLYRACCLDDIGLSDAGPTHQSSYFGLSLVSSSSRAMRDLYDRSSRRPLCVPKLWLVEDLLEKDLRRCNKAEEYEALLVTPVLRICPFLVSFKKRLKLFERIVNTNRVAIQGEQSQNPFSPGLKPGVPVRIMRGRILEDGLLTLNKLGRNLRQRIAVQYVSETGARETGVDVGGLFKEFWTDLSALAFNPNYALFRVTEGAGNCLYPNPSSGAAHGPDHIVLFEFLGRILGKALFEGITIQPRFAHFFLSFMRGSYNYLNMLPDLSTLDPTLYHNLMFLKTYDGNAEDLCLTFTVTDNDFGGNKEINLIPNGTNIAVTNSNKQQYIELVAKYHVCDRVKEQSEAFTRGLWEVIDREWLKVFNEPELQVLISGATDGKLDVADMRANTRYAGGYTTIDRNVHRFWNVVSSFSSQQQADLLRFATSCERPPPLGFASMNPPFTIQRVGILRDRDKLPTASTCFNVLKLPTYSSEKVLRERLLYAIQSGAGFELT